MNGNVYVCVCEWKEEWDQQKEGEYTHIDISRMYTVYIEWICIE